MDDSFRKEMNSLDHYAAARTAAGGRPTGNTMFFTGADVDVDRDDDDLLSPHKPDVRLFESATRCVGSINFESHVVINFVYRRMCQTRLL